MRGQNPGQKTMGWQMEEIGKEEWEKNGRDWKREWVECVEQCG